MSDRAPDDEDHDWLLARERGEPGPTISEARAHRYAQLGTLIADLPAIPAGIAQRENWEHGVLALIDAEAGQPADQSRTPTTAASDKPRPHKPTTTGRRRWRTAMAMSAVAVAGVAVVVFMQRDLRPAVRSVPPTSPTEVTRGMHVERGRLGFDHVLQVRRSKAAVFHELRDGDTVMTGDRIRVSVTTSTDAYLYLAFCAEQHLQMYPSQRGVRTRSGELVLVPEGEEQLVIDNHPGSEVLYLLLSQSELPLADPALAALLAAIGDGTKPVACDKSLDLRLVKSTATAPSSNVLRGERIAKHPEPGSRTEPPVGDGGPREVIAADADGIAVVRYTFIHVAAENVDDP